jgi:flagellar hook assembly protein FlgD
MLFGQGQRRPRVQLGQNYPNPFNPTTTIPFPLPPELFESGKAVVTIRIYNALQQLVAVPKALDHPTAGDVLDLEYTAPGWYEAYWDGTDKNGRKVASGVYYMRLEVNGERAPPRKMVVAK